MRPLPRLHAVTDATVLAREDLGVRAAAIASAGSAVALHARDRAAGGAALHRVASRFLALTRPPEASLFVNARADIAATVGAQGLHLGQGDLPVGEARRVLTAGMGPSLVRWVGVSAHTESEAARAADEGADYLMVGSIYESASHPGGPVRGLGLLRASARLGLPVIAIGGITAARAVEARDAGAWGVAAISSLWAADDPARAAVALLAPWSSP
jgi:thiamine-phosphate pyrophosphorylase